MSYLPIIIHYSTRFNLARSFPVSVIASCRGSRSQAGFGPREARLNIWEDIIGL